MKRPTAKAINKPLLIAGIERGLLGLGIAFSAALCYHTPKVGPFPIVGIVAFPIFVVVAKWATRKDERMIRILPAILQRKPYYSAWEREICDIEIVKGDSYEDED